MLEKDIKKVLFSQEDIVAKTKELGQQLTKDYEGKNPLLVGVLKGAVPFMAELIKHIDTHLEMDFMVVSSYGGGTVSSGEVKILKDVDTNVEGRDIIFIEDIIDTGRTLLYLRDMFKYRKANSVKIATLFDKPWLLAECFPLYLSDYCNRNRSPVFCWGKPKSKSITVLHAVG